MTISKRNPWPGRTLLLDGGLGTLLAARGVDVSGPAWSARAVEHAPGSVRAAHAAFFAAGAEIAIAASYQTADPGLAARAVALAREARGEGSGLVAGSIGPYGALLADRSEYSGDYPEPAGGWAAFHAPRLAALLDAGADLLACETLPRFDEAVALAASAGAAGAAAWISVTLRDATHMADGTPLAALAAALDREAGVVALGVNCCPASAVLPALAALGRGTKKPLVAYPNAAGGADPVSWAAAGARLVGGCCGTGPAEIAGMRRLLDASPHGSARGVSSPA